VPCPGGAGVGAEPSPARRLGCGDHPQLGIRILRAAVTVLWPNLQLWVPWTGQSALPTHGSDSTVSTGAVVFVLC